VPHFSVLNHLMRVEDGRTPLELPAPSRCRRRRSHWLAGLEKLGWVELKPNPDDGRSKRVWLTDAGRAFRDGAIAEIAPDLARIEEVMGAEEVADIVARLERLRSGSTPTAERGRDFEFAGQRPSKAVSPFEVGSGPMRALGQRGHEGQDFVDRLARRDLRHDGRAHDAAIGDACDRLRGLGRLDAEAHDHRQIGRALIRATSGPTSPACASAAPVIPVIET
jgi:hypothetical protein